METNLPSSIIFFFIVISIWGIIYIISYLLKDIFDKSKIIIDAENFIRTNLPIGICFSFLGLTIGLLSGASLSPVMKDIVPAILTFIGGLAIYLIAHEEKMVINVKAIILSIITFCFFMLFGIEKASIIRIEKEKENNIEEFEIFKKEQILKSSLEKEIKLLQFQIDSALIIIKANKKE